MLSVDALQHLAAKGVKMFLPPTVASLGMLTISLRDYCRARKLATLNPNPNTAVL
jgi:hypothetical protein